MSRSQIVPVDVFVFKGATRVRFQQFFDKDMAFQFAVSLFNSCQCNVQVTQDEDRFLTLYHDFCPAPLSRPAESDKK